MKQEDGNGFIEEYVELVISPATEYVGLLRFLCQAKEILEDNFNNVVQFLGSWDRGIIIKMTLKDGQLDNLLNKLSIISDVEALQDEPPTKFTFSKLSREFEIRQRSSISQSKRIKVTPKETHIPTDMAKQTLATVVN